MEISNSQYIKLIVIHIFIGLLVFSFRDFSKLYAFLILLVGFYFIVKNKNANNEVLLVCAYLVGSEAFLRMTKGFPIYEFGKYAVVFFCLIGMIYSGFSKNAIPYWIFIFLLAPSVIIATESLNLTTDIRKNISFNISGPLCLGISSVYNYNRKITFLQLNKLLLFIGLPILTTVVYLYFYTPDIKEVITGTASSSKSSGGFGPNQVATILGLGLFVFFTRLILFSKNKYLVIINLIIVFNITFRGLSTFSRGGMITSGLMILILVLVIYLNSKSQGRYKLSLFLVGATIIFSGIWMYTQVQTNGMIGLRYANKDALGREKDSQFTGREEIAEGEINIFLENPFLGVGMAKSVESRAEESGAGLPSHNEITRTLAEQGALGILGLVIILLTPLILYIDNKSNIYLLSFLVFWLLTINHSAMRLAAPAFIYSLALLKVKFDEETITVHR